MDSAKVFENLFAALPGVHSQHDPRSQLYSLLKHTVRKEVECFFSAEDPVARDFQPFGNLVFPYHSMGNIDSMNLFDLDELIIFSFYWTNRHRYRRVLDGGANLGLHSVILSKCGYDVTSYEPDPVHFSILQNNLELNGCSGVKPVNAAISTEDGTVEFVRVLGNTTGSHIPGFKPNPYGELERFPVRTEPFKPLIAWADLVKLDVEGHEGLILLDTTRDDWLTTDAMIEVGTVENAELIFKHFNAQEISLFAQKTNWGLVRRIDDMPTSHHDGSLFVTCKSEMPW